MMRPAIEHGLQAFRDFRRTWPQLLLVTLATRVAVALFMLPGLALLLRFFLSQKGRAALSDQEILFFFLSPIGVVALVVGGGTWIGIALVEQAGLMVVGFGAAEDRRVTWFSALRYVFHESPRILLLGSRLLVRTTVLAGPMLALVGGVYWAFLRQYDINYYLANRPPEFLWAAGIAGVLVAGLAVLLAVKVVGWMLALPAVLFENLGPLAAIRDSIADSRGHRWKIFWWIVAWLAAGATASAALTWTIGLVGRLIVPQGGDALALTAFTMGAIGLLSLIANALLSFLSASLFALLVVRLYRDFSGPGALARELAEPGSLGDRPAIRVPRRGLLWGGALAAAASVVAAVMLVQSVRLEDDTLIIAHRGAALHAPENTLASVRRAIEDSTDYIEIDVQETADGEVVVFHDSDFMKTAGNPLTIWDALRADIEAIDVGSWFDPAYATERVPTLEEVLLAAKDQARVNIELKYYGHDEDLERKVIDIVERTGMVDQVVLMSLKYDKVQKIR
ncbi:MAG: glycerophosphoryl diester phosphodiesterase membrane domain-containing protein, partial [Gemmatimonadetes bacterium]|nr:glycerophosphoryl diester phosphodiesterase membrane domain-containing protein [Gemmatimonadota bacterium]